MSRLGVDKFSARSNIAVPVLAIENAIQGDASILTFTAVAPITAAERVVDRTRAESSLIWSLVVPADGTSAANVGNGDLRYVAADFGQLSDKPLPVRIRSGGVSHLEAQ